ncbi:MAG TPA: penicillin-insensitive murein endopeptidase [Solirubrobacterales bacterium]|nr:penicillin-insensitive murein endopeptidase [Solirubrobacterales bacterium]
MPRRSRTSLALVTIVAVVPVGLIGGGALTTSQGAEPATAEVATFEAGDLQWRGSVSAGQPWRGLLFRGVQLPPEGADFFTWDFPLRIAPNRPWRRWAADRTLFVLLRVLAEYRAANPEAGRVGIADLSRPAGGSFGRRFGGLGHASHQNGIDVDLLYPRRDLLELAPSRPAQIDRLLAQDLVDRFVAAGARYVFVGPRTGLRGPRKIVRPLVHHDDHMHLRFFTRGGRVRD